MLFILLYWSNLNYFSKRQILIADVSGTQLYPEKLIKTWLYIIPLVECIRIHRASFMLTNSSVCTLNRTKRRGTWIGDLGDLSRSYFFHYRLRIFLVSCPMWEKRRLEKILMLLLFWIIMIFIIGLLIPLITMLYIKNLFMYSLNLNQCEIGHWIRSVSN